MQQIYDYQEYSSYTKRPPYTQLNEDIRFEDSSILDSQHKIYLFGLAVLVICVWLKESIQAHQPIIQIKLSFAKETQIPQSRSPALAQSRKEIFTRQAQIKEEEKQRRNRQLSEFLKREVGLNSSQIEMIFARDLRFHEEIRMADHLISKQVPNAHVLKKKIINRHHTWMSTQMGAPEYLRYLKKKNELSIFFHLSH